VRVIEASRPESRLPSSGPSRFVRGLCMSNGVIDADFDETGRVVGLRRSGDSRELCAAGRELGELWVYEDRPRNWDAWDIDAEYEQKGERMVFAADGVQINAMGPVRTRLVRRAKFGRRSEVIQEYVLDAGSPRLDVRTTVEWREEHRLLRAVFPTTVRAAHATYECAFGHVVRSTGRNTPTERAAFEVPGHRWFDLSEAGAGLAVLNDCKYGHSCHDGTMGLSLLRAPTFPDEKADRGMHRFVYSMMPHAGDWRVAGVDAQAELLNAPVTTWMLPKEQPGDLGNSWAPVSVSAEGGARAAVTAIKVAEADDRLIVRVCETHGRAGVIRIRWTVPVSGVEVVDLHEQPMAAGGMGHDAATGVTEVKVRAFELVTLGTRRA
jgi:alpha-mannosidase